MESTYVVKKTVDSPEFTALKGLRKKVPGTFFTETEAWGNVATLP
jgi:hypothetical protein